jgi:hypothetical protein
MNQAAGTVTFTEIETPETATPRAKDARKGKTVAPSRRGRTTRAKATPTAGNTDTP